MMSYNVLYNLFSLHTNTFALEHITYFQDFNYSPLRKYNQNLHFKIDLFNKSQSIAPKPF